MCSEPRDMVVSEQPAFASAGLSLDQFAPPGMQQIDLIYILIHKKKVQGVWRLYNMYWKVRLKI